MRAWAGENGFEPGYEFSEDWTGTQLDRPKLDEIKRLAQAGEIEAQGGETILRERIAEIQATVSSL